MDGEHGAAREEHHQIQVMPITCLLYMNVCMAIESHPYSVQHCLAYLDTPGNGT